MRAQARGTGQRRVVPGDAGFVAAGFDAEDFHGGGRGLGLGGRAGPGRSRPVVARPRWLPLSYAARRRDSGGLRVPRSEEHTSELQSLMRISYAVFCLKKKTIYKITK